jgi:hypothetical protein
VSPPLFFDESTTRTYSIKITLLISFVKASIFMYLIVVNIGCDGVDWIDMVQDRGQWRALVNTVLDLRFP